MRKINLSDVKEAGDFRRPTAGAYICKITAVEDIKEKEYLKVYYDIDDGDLKGYYTEARTNHPEWLWMAHTSSHTSRRLCHCSSGSVAQSVNRTATMSLTLATSTQRSKRWSASGSA